MQGRRRSGRQNSYRKAAGLALEELERSLGQLVSQPHLLVLEREKRTAGSRAAETPLPFPSLFHVATVNSAAVDLGGHVSFGIMFSLHTWWALRYCALCELCRELCL